MTSEDLDIKLPGDLLLSLLPNVNLTKMILNEDILKVFNIASFLNRLSGPNLDPLSILCGILSRTLVVAYRR